MSVAQKKLVTFLKKKHPELSDKSINQLLISLKRFVNVVQKIYTQPQAQIKIKNKQRIITTDLEEFSKILRKNKTVSLTHAFGEFNKSVTKDKYGRKQK